MGHAKHRDGPAGNGAATSAQRKSNFDKLAKAAMSREILAAGLTAAAAAIAASPKSRKAIRDAGLDTADNASQAASAMMTSASKLGSLIADAVADAAQRVLSNSNRLNEVQIGTGHSGEIKGEGMGDLISLTDLEAHLNSMVDDESTDWAASELLGVLEAAETIGVVRSTLDNWRRTKKVLAFSKGLRNFVFPMDQFDGSKPLTGLESVRLHFLSDEDAWEWLVTPERILENRRPIDLLREGRVDEAVRAAEGALDFA